MKRGIIVFVSLCIPATVAYFTVSKWAIRHETLSFYDAARNRPVDVDIAVRRDTEMRANAGLITLPVAILNHGNTVRFTEYSFLANVFAARGYMAVSIQQLRTIQPHSDYDHLTMVGHSNGGDISMYFARIHPDQVKKVVTLDNLRVPFMTDGKFKILSFRSRDPVFKADAGVVPDDGTCDKVGITVIRTSFQHTDMSDRGPDDVKSSIQTVLDKFLDDDSHPAPVNDAAPKVSHAAPADQATGALN